jgi:hypothetical protein
MWVLALAFYWDVLLAGFWAVYSKPLFVMAIHSIAINLSKWVRQLSGKPGDFTPPDSGVSGEEGQKMKADGKMSHYRNRKVIRLF